LQICPAAQLPQTTLDGLLWPHESTCEDCAERLAEVEHTLLQLKFDCPSLALIARNP